MEILPTLTPNLIKLSTLALDSGKYLTNNGTDFLWGTPAGIGGVVNHNLLNNLDYASAAHTGFQKELTLDNDLKCLLT